MRIAMFLVGAVVGAGAIVGLGLAWERHMRAVRAC
jgi:hypothetical protein